MGLVLMIRHKVDSFDFHVVRTATCNFYMLSSHKPFQQLYHSFQTVLNKLDTGHHTELSLYPLKCLLLPERSPSSKWISVVPRSWTWRPRRLDKVDAVSNNLLFDRLLSCVSLIVDLVGRCFVYLTLQVFVGVLVVVVVALLVVGLVVLAVVVLAGVESQVRYESYRIQQDVSPL
ncbi:hypothetical protein BpHYR1_041700 [Brachionus plicatilis]|uniref:Uncharacterized protein n=1 Tax=Brachionus plicatilis TaxID=10195 RepID=A0A3M7Q7I4_BRAPC|nr:hypothetical protein BpHYR1_041700 [Brachionus plicatilis]